MLIFFFKWSSNNFENTIRSIPFLIELNAHQAVFKQETLYQKFILLSFITYHHTSTKYSAVL